MIEAFEYISAVACLLTLTLAAVGGWVAIPVVAYMAGRDIVSAWNKDRGLAVFGLVFTPPILIVGIGVASFMSAMALSLWSMILQ